MVVFTYLSLDHYKSVRQLWIFLELYLSANNLQLHKAWREQVFCICTSQQTTVSRHQHICYSVKAVVCFISQGFINMLWLCAAPQQAYRILR